MSGPRKYVCSHNIAATEGAYRSAKLEVGSHRIAIFVDPWVSLLVEPVECAVHLIWVPLGGEAVRVERMLALEVGSGGLIGGNSTSIPELDIPIAELLRVGSVRPSERSEKIVVTRFQLNGKIEQKQNGANLRRDAPSLDQCRTCEKGEQHYYQTGDGTVMIAERERLLHSVLPPSEGGQQH